MTGTDKARVRKTPAEKAAEALRIAEAEVSRLDTKKTRLDAELLDCDLELVAATKRRDYLAQNPDLPKGLSIGTLTADVEVNVKPATS